MEIAHVQMSGAALEASRRPIEVSHGDTGLARTLTPREEIVLTDLNGELFSARVLLVDGSDPEPVYFLALGKRLSLTEAARRLDEVDRRGAMAQAGNTLPF